MICGGMMSGNCAIGSPCLDTSPASTVTMAMTMATIGRLMKKRDMDVGAGALLSLRRRLPRFRVHHAAVATLRPFDDDPLARLEACVDEPAAADAFAGLDRPRRDVVV